MFDADCIGLRMRAGEVDIVEARNYCSTAVIPERSRCHEHVLQGQRQKLRVCSIERLVRALLPYWLACATSPHVSRYRHDVLERRVVWPMV